MFVDKMCDLFLYMKWRNMDVLVEQFCMNCVTRRNKHYAAQICQVIYFMVQTCNSSLLYQHLYAHGQNNNDDDGE